MWSYLAAKGDAGGAIAGYREIITGAQGYLKATTQADREAALRPDGYLIRELRRPEYVAFLALARLHQAQGDDDKATTTIRELAGFFDQDPWHLEIHPVLGRFYEQRGLKAEALGQYTLALESLRIAVEENKRRYPLYVWTAPASADAESPSNSVQRQIREIRQRVSALGPKSRPQ